VCFLGLFGCTVVCFLVFGALSGAIQDCKFFSYARIAI
jgi:hypothetical protein